MSEGTRDELERQRARWWATVSSGDLDGYLSLFAEEAVWVTPELDEIVGREAIRAWLAPVFAQFDYELTITVADVRVAGALGIERARFVSRMTPKPPSVRPLPTPPLAEPAAQEPPDAGEVGEAGEAEVVTAADEVLPAPDAAGGEPLVGDEAGLIQEDVDEPSGIGTELAGDQPAASADDVPGPGEDADEASVDAPLVPAGPDGGEDEPHEGRYLMYWRWHDDAGWLVHRYADVTGVG